MRIVMVAPQVGDAFGQERALSRSCELLTNAGHTISLVADRIVGNPPAHACLLLVPGLSSMHTLSSPTAVQSSVANVLSFLQDNQTDVVHLQDCFDFRFIRSIGKSYATLL